MPFLGVFFRKRSSLLFWQKDNFIIVGKRNTIYTEDTENIIFPCIFWERSSFICRLKNKNIFSGKRNIIFPDNSRKIVFQCDFLERIAFQNIWKKKMWFFVQCLCHHCTWILHSCRLFNKNEDTKDSLYLDYPLPQTSLCLKLLLWLHEYFHHIQGISLYLEPLYLEPLSISNKNLSPVATILSLSQTFYLYVL